MKRGFFAGAVFAFGLEMWFQDHLGLAGYQAHVAENWVTLSPWVGASVAAFGFFGALRSKRPRCIRCGGKQRRMCPTCAL